MSKLKVKIKAEGKDAERVLQTMNGLPPRTNNYVSRDELHIPPGANSNKQKGSERLSDSTQNPNPVGDHASGLHDRPSDAEYKAHAFPELHYGADQVRHEMDAREVPVTSLAGNRNKMPADSPEAVRQKNNRARDMRTNLGKGKHSIVETE